MIQSMTGYGAAQFSEEAESFAVELRTVNNRYLKLSIKVSDDLAFSEPLIEKLLRSRIGRGSVECAVRIRSDKRATSLSVNASAVQQYVTQLSQIKLPDRIQATIDLAAIALLPGSTEKVEPSTEQCERYERIVKRLVGTALDALSAMRGEEGRALSSDLQASCVSIRDRLTVIGERAPFVVDEYHTRLRQRVSALTSAAALVLESDALSREVAIYAERCDISEEITRIHSHLAQFDELCARGDQVGRTLDFLTQELLREANTIGSKSNDAQISRNVVEIKGLIDRLREQVQNVE